LTDKAFEYKVAPDNYLFRATGKNQFLECSYRQCRLWNWW